MFGLYQNRDEYGISSDYFIAHSCIDGQLADCTTLPNHPHMFKSKNTVPGPKQLMQFYSAVVRSYQGLLGNKCRGESTLRFESNRLEYDETKIILDQSYLWSGCDIENIYKDESGVVNVTPVAELIDMMTCNGVWETENGCLVIPKRQMKPFTTVNSDCFPTWINPITPPPTTGDDTDEDTDSTDSCDIGISSTPGFAGYYQATDPYEGWQCFFVSKNIENQIMKNYADKEIVVMQGYFSVFAKDGDGVTEDKMRYVAAVAATMINGYNGREGLDNNSNTKAYMHMKEKTMAHILIVPDDATDTFITEYRNMLHINRTNTGYPDFDEEGKMVRILKASEVDLARNKFREHDRTLEYVLRNIFIWAHTQVEKELNLNDHTSKIARFNSEYGHSGKSLYDYAYTDPCTADSSWPSNVQNQCQRLEIMVFCVGAYQQWYNTEENRLWVQNHDTTSDQTFKRMDDSRPRFNMGHEKYSSAHYSVRCEEPMIKFLRPI